VGGMSVRAAVIGARSTSGTHSIQFWLRWLVLVCLLPAWAITTWLIVISGLRERDAREHSTIDTARALMQTVDRELASSVVGLQALATSPFLASQDFANFHRQASEALANLAGSDIVLLDRTGQQVINTSTPFGAPLPRQEMEHSIVEVFQTARPTVTDLFVGRLDSQPTVGIVVPIIDKGTVAYVLGMGVSPEHLGEILYSAKLPEDWISGIVDSTGTIVARTQNAKRFVGKKAAPELLRKIAELPEGIIEGETQDGIPVAVSFSRSTVSGWAVGIAIPRAELMAPLYRSLELTISAAVAVLLLALSIAWVISSHIARSIRALGEPALALAADTSVLVPPLAIREVNEIGGALVKASQLLGERRIAREKAEQEALRESEERLRTAIEAGHMAIWERDYQNDTYIWSDELYRMFGYRVGEVAPSGAIWFAHVHPDDREVVKATGIKAEREREGCISEFRIVRRDGAVRWVRTRTRFALGDGNRLRVVGLVEDITDDKGHIETQRVLVAELQHRTRNLMAVVQSIAHQTLDNVDSLADFEDRFNRRLEALSRAQSLLSRADNEPITLHALLVTEFEALGLDAVGSKIDLFGGPEAPLRKSAVEMFALAIHELLTNAIKYGAFASETGSLSVTWRIEGMLSDQRLVLEWIERGIASSPQAPDARRSGYGRTLIEEALPYSLSAVTKFELDSDGLRCRIGLPLAPSEPGESPHGDE
jgi:PAS domain S-box-containing protein